ncbi:MAG TPA: retropepsin-like aspartic protease [Pyrinomonadaceae bacterium]|nr:retropepsin-like aspartic protease [Pyrinomonadaceae bacterium]
MKILLCCLLITVFVSSAEAGGKQQVVEIPFDFYRNEIILQVKVNGKGPFNMMLDTGTDPSAVDLTTAKEIGLKLHPLGKPGEGGGTDVNLAYYTELPLVEVAGFTVKNVETLALDLSKVSERLGKPLHGVLGHSVLKGRIAQIDYPNRVVRFYSQPLFSKAPNTPKRSMLSFRYSDNVLLDDVLVNGKKIVGNLDTGSDGTFKLTPAAVGYLGLEEDFNQAPVSTDVGYNGVSQNRQGKVNNVTVGAISVDAPAVIFFAKGTGRDKKPWGINIGNAFLKDFILTIDYRNKLVTLERP